MAKTTNIQPLLDRHLQLIGEGRFEEVEADWIEQMAVLPVAGEFFKPWLGAMRCADALDRAEMLVALLVEEHLERQRPKDALRVVLAALPTFDQSDLLRPLMLQGLRQRYAHLEHLEPFIRLSGLDGGVALAAAYKQFRDWLRLAPGQVYQHYDWGEGVVQQLDLATGKVVLAFPGEPGKAMTIEGVRQFLTWIEPRHFLARRAKEPEALQALAEDRPVELIKLALGGLEDRQLRQADLKAMLVGVIVPDHQWTGWWSRAREALAVDPYVDFDRGGGARGWIRLRDKPRTFAQGIEEGFFDPEIGTAGRVELIRQLARKPKDAHLPAELVERIAGRLWEEWSLTGDSDPVVRLEIAFMLEDLAQAVPDARIAPPDPAPILGQIGDYRELFAVDHHEYGARALVRLIERDGQAGIRQAAALLPQAPVKLAQAIWEAMAEEQHVDQGVQALQKLFDRPLDNPETFAWALRATLDGSWEHLEDDFPAQAMVPELIEQMEHWQRVAEDAAQPRERREAARRLLSRGRALLSAEHFELLSRAVAGLSRESAGRLRRQIQTHPALNAGFKSQADRAIGVTRRDLGESADGPAAGPTDDVFLCTARAQVRAMAEMREITSVRIPHNSKVIGEARREGDLRENAGYQYAKEEQKMLVQQQATLSDLLSRAHVVRAKDVDAGRVGFGTRFTVRNLQSGENETYTLLGRWEADAEQGILSEQAPLARQFTGRKVGEKLRIERPGAPATDYEVLTIENALADSEWKSGEA